MVFGSRRSRRSRAITAIVDARQKVCQELQAVHSSKVGGVAEPLTTRRELLDSNECCCLRISVPLRPGFWPKSWFLRFLPVEKSRVTLQASTQKKRFRPGDLAPITGIYVVIHDLRHREPHEVVIIRGEQLPPCRTCKAEMCYEIVRAVSHVTHDWDFSGPNNLVIRPQHEAFHDFRMFRRVHLQLPITVECPGWPVTIPGHSSDLSAGGIGTIIRNKLPSRIKSAVVRINSQSGQKELSFRAQLRYQSGLRYGFEFTNVKATDRESIRRLIENRKRRAADVAG